MPQNPNYSMSFKDEERGTKEICRAIKFKPTSELQLQKITGLLHRPTTHIYSTCNVTKNNKKMVARSL